MQLVQSPNTTPSTKSKPAFNPSSAIGRAVRKALDDAGFEVIQCFSDKFESTKTRRLKYIVALKFPEDQEHIDEVKKDGYEYVVEDLRALRLRCIRSIGWDKDKVTDKEFMKVVIDL
jgi:hypothetical protein